jgi:hypothetical protein
MEIVPIHPHPIVDITDCASGVRVWVRGVPFEDFATLSNAARCASALKTLEALGLLDRVLDVQDVVRGMLTASRELHREHLCGMGEHARLDAGLDGGGA